MDSALSRVQDHFTRLEAKERSEIGFPPELVPDVKTLAANAGYMRRLGFDVQLSPYLESLMRIENSKELFKNASAV